MDYTDPLNRFIDYGSCQEITGWPDYLKLGLTHEHIPELIRMVTDRNLPWADQDSLEVWAPVHAWRALGQLRAEEAIKPLIGLFDELITSRRKRKKSEGTLRALAGAEKNIKNVA